MYISVSFYLSIYLSIYIYIYIVDSVYLYTYKYIYIYIDRIHIYIYSDYCLYGYACVWVFNTRYHVYMDILTVRIRNKHYPLKQQLQHLLSIASSSSFCLTGVLALQLLATGRLSDHLCEHKHHKTRLTWYAW